MKPSDLVRRQPQHGILFGEPKTGKSTLVSQLLTAGYNLTWISMDNGHSVIFKLPLLPEELDARLNIVVLPDTDTRPVAFKTVQDILAGKDTQICDKHGQSGCSTCRGKKEATWSQVNVNNFGPNDILVLDHLGQLSDSIMNFLIVKGGKDITDITDSKARLELDHYRIQGILLGRLLTNVQQAPYNIICIAQSMETVLEDGQKKITPLVGTANFSAGVSKYFDWMVYAAIYNGSHRFGSKSTFKNQIQTGSRTDIVIEEMKMPSLSPFFDGSKKVELAGASAAAKLLSTAVKVVPEIKEETKQAVEKIEEMDKLVAEFEDSMLSKDEIEPPTPPVDREAMLKAMAEASQKNSPVYPASITSLLPTTTPAPAVDRLALLAKLKLGKK